MLYFNRYFLFHLYYKLYEEKKYEPDFKIIACCYVSSLKLDQTVELKIFKVFQSLHGLLQNSDHNQVIRD